MSRGGRNTKIHLIADAHGCPKAICLTGRQRHDSVPAQVMLGALPRNLRMIADAAYDIDQLRQSLAERSRRVVIPNRQNRKRLHPSTPSSTSGAISSSAPSAASRTSGALPFATIGLTQPSSPRSASLPRSPTSSNDQMSLGPNLMSFQLLLVLQFKYVVLD